jgi:hypothetical protein
VPLQTWGLTTLPTQAPTWIDPSQWTQFNADAGLDLAFLSEPPEIRDLPTPQKSSSSPSDARTPPAMDSLPDTPLFLDLIDIFFERLYSYVPVLHKKKLVESVTCNGIDAVPSSLVFAIAAVTASHHPDQSVQARQDGWFLDAKRDMTKHMHAQDHAVQSLQAAVLIIYQAVVKTDFSTTWILLGEAWRKAVAIGCSQVDGGKIRVMPALGFDFRSNWIETEEARRVTWVLYMFDRGVCFSVGLVHAIDDRRLRINLPMPEDAFQAASPDSFEPTLKDPIKFCADLDAMITSAQAHCRNKSASMLQLLILAYILLSNISEVMHSVDFDHDKDESKLETCIAHLVRIQLMLPQFATDLSAARYEDFPAVVWLNFLLATCTILLHHRPLKGGETLDGPSSMASHWPHCVAASRNSVSMIRQASRSSTNLLTNAHIPTLLFSLSRILVIEYFCPSQAKYGADPNAKGVEPPANVVRDSALRENLGVLALSFTRLRDALDRVGQKFYKGFAFWVMEGPKVSPEAKRIGSLTLLHTCENWPAVPDDQDIDIPS